MAIGTVGDLLQHFPRRYIDRSRVASIRALRIGEYATVIGRVSQIEKRRTRKRQAMVTVRIYDGTGYLDLPFFNQPWIATRYREGMEVAVSGVVGLFSKKLQLQNQEIEILHGDDELVHTARVTPVHPATEGITTRTIRELVHRSLEQLTEIPDPLPE